MGLESLHKVVLFCFLIHFASHVDADVQELTEDNWQEMLEGEWVVMFYAPWCPACKSLTSVWEQLGQRSFDLGIRVAKIDVTQNPVLSGRFFITALPTIYHVKDAAFRQYKGHRSNTEVIAFVREEVWKDVEPLSWYWSPTSFHMGTVGRFFQFSINIRNVHSSMTEDYGIPVWCSYIIFALFTIFLGLLIGLIIVCLCDAVQVSRHRRHSASVQAKTAAQSEPATGTEHDHNDVEEEPETNNENDFDLLEDDDLQPGSEPTTAGDVSSSGGAAGGDSTVRRRDTTKHADNVDAE